MRSKQKNGGMRKVRLRALRVNPFVLKPDSLTRSAKRKKGLQKFIREDNEIRRLSTDKNKLFNNALETDLPLTPLEKQQYLAEIDENISEEIFSRREEYPTIKHYIMKREKNAKATRG